MTQAFKTGALVAAAAAALAASAFANPTPTTPIMKPNVSAPQNTSLAGMRLQGTAGTSSSSASASTSSIAQIVCDGGNACKSRGMCKSASNDCKGKNGCKGKSWVYVDTAQECRDAGGTVAAQLPTGRS